MMEPCILDEKELPDGVNVRFRGMGQRNFLKKERNTAQRSAILRLSSDLERGRCEG